MQRHSMVFSLSLSLSRFSFGFYSDFYQPLDSRLIKKKKRRRSVLNQFLRLNGMNVCGGGVRAFNR